MSGRTRHIALVADRRAAAIEIRFLTTRAHELAATGATADSMSGSGTCHFLSKVCRVGWHPTSFATSVASVAQEPEPRRRVSCSYRSHGVQHEPESYTPTADSRCAKNVR